MANEEQLAILKQGVDVWNRWREENPDIEINLSGNYSHYIDLTRAYFNKFNLSKANISYAALYGASFISADLSEANLTSADLSHVKFHYTNLKGANLSNSTISTASFIDANLSEAKLMGNSSFFTNFDGANLANTNFTNIRLHGAVFGNNDLSSCIGLEKIHHSGASHISTSTIQKSKGKIPVDFLRGCGLSDIDIEYTKLADPKLTAQEISEITHKIFELKDTRPIQISPLFISYSHANSEFVNELETKLNEKGIRYWRDIHDATAGRLETQIDKAIRQNPTVLLILSKHSTSSDWVEHEARLARKLEKELGRDVLCPIALDDSWKTCNWPERIKEQIEEYNILDFSNWEDDDELDAMFKRLIDGLDMLYKG